MLLKKLTFMSLALLILMLSVNFVNAEPCDVSDLKDTLRKSLYLYFTDPGANSLQLEEVKDLLIFYLSISSNQQSVECSIPGAKSNKSIIDILNRGRNTPDRIPSCTDDTKYGECSKNKPNYCYRGKLFKRCTHCGCTQGKVCDGNACVDSKRSIDCNSDSECGNLDYKSKFFCDGEWIVERTENYTCQNPGTISSNCGIKYSTKNIRQCNNSQGRYCVDGQPECQDKPINYSLTKDKIVLDQIYISDNTVDIIYSKNFPTCLHVISENGSLIHTQNYFCREGDNKMQFGNLSNFKISSSKKYKVCHGNNRKVCSDFKKPIRVYNNNIKNVIAAKIAEDKYIIKFNNSEGFNWIETRKSNGDYKTGGTLACRKSSNSVNTTIYDNDFPLITYYTDCKSPNTIYRIPTYASTNDPIVNDSVINDSIGCSPPLNVKQQITSASLVPSPPRNIYVKIYAGSSNPDKIYGQIDYKGWTSNQFNNKTDAVVVLIRHERSGLGPRNPILFKGGKLTLNIDNARVTANLPSHSVCWSCNLWFIVYKDGKVEQWLDGQLSVDQWANNKIQACGDNGSRTEIHLNRLFKGQFNNTKYSINVTDLDGINEFDIRKRTGTPLYSGAPNCLTDINSGTVTLNYEDFPLKGYLFDCKSNLKHEIYVPYPPLLTEVCNDSDGGKDYFTTGTVYLPNQNFEDYCDGNYLNEYYCNTSGNDIIVSQDRYHCANGCKIGSCSKESTVLCPTCLPKDLVLYMTFNSSNGSAAQDITQYQNHGEIHGATWTKGRFDGGLYFDGDDYIVVPDSYTLDIKNQITVAAWVKLDHNSSSAKILQKGWTQKAYQLGAWFANPNGFAFEIYDNERNQHLVDSGTNPITGEWQHVAASYDGSVMRMYLNGIETGFTNYSGKISTSDDDLYIGIQQNLLMGLNGVLDEIHIYNVSKNPESICKHANKIWVNGFCKEELGFDEEFGLIGHWRFDGNGNNEVAGPQALKLGKTNFHSSGGVNNNGYARVHTGSDSIRIPYSSIFDLESEFTVDLWFRQRSNQSFNQNLIYKGFPRNNYNFNIFRFPWNQFNQGAVISGFTSSSTGFWKQTSNPNEPAMDRWHHVAFTKSKSGSAYYIDGRAIHTSTYTDLAKTPKADIIIADSAVDTDIDEVRIHNRPLNSNEIKNYYESLSVKLQSEPNCHVKIDGKTVKSVYAQDRQDCYTKTSYGSINCKNYTSYFTEGTHFLEQYYGETDRVNNEYCTCNNGVCLQGRESCIDYDAGDDVFNASYAKKGSQTQFDKCGTPSQNYDIIEGVCRNGELSGIPHNCPSGTTCKEINFVAAINRNVSACVNNNLEGPIFSPDSMRSNRIYNMTIMNASFPISKAHLYITKGMEKYYGYGSRQTQLSLNSGLLYIQNSSYNFGHKVYRDWYYTKYGDGVNPNHLAVIISDLPVNQSTGQLLDIKIQTDDGEKKVYFPKIPKCPGTNHWRVFYISMDGSTYYATNNHQCGYADLSPEEAIVSTHLARAATQ